MKISILFNGHIRTLPRTIKVYHDLFKNHEVDVFINTYESVGFWSDKKSVDDSESINVEYIKEIVKPFNLVIFNLIDINEINRVKFIEKFNPIFDSNKIYYTRPFNWLSMHFTRLELLDIFFQKKIKSYDLVYLIRPDLIIDYEIIKPLENKDLLYISKDVFIEGEKFYGDFFIIGNEDNMKKLKEKYLESIENYVKFKGFYDPHSLLYHILMFIFDEKIINKLKYDNSFLLNTPSGYCKKY